MHSILRRMLIAAVLLAAYALAGLIYLFPYLGLPLAGFVLVAFFRRVQQYYAYGTARWADPMDIPHMLDGSGLILGHVETKPTRVAGVRALFNRAFSNKMACLLFLMAFQRKPTKLLVRLTQAVHTLICAPTGVGKGVSCILPFLLTCRDSCVVVDFKGENAKITADARRQMGHKTVLLDPFKVVTPTPDAFNPLQFIDPESPTALDECRDLAEALVVRTGEEKEPHWADSAEIWIAAMVAFTVCFANDEDKNLQSVRMLLTHPEKMQVAIKLMCESDKWGGMLARLGSQLTNFKDKELSSTLTTTNRFLRFLDTLPVADSTKKSSFNPADLVKGKLSVYLVLPPEHMRAQGALLRMWIGSLLRACVKGGLQETNKIQFVLDEAASLGHMESLDDAIDKFRGYGVRLQLYYQSMGQLKLCWPEGRDQTVLSNTTQLFFGVNDQQTAEYVSNRLGEGTIIVASGGTSEGQTWQSAKGGGSGSTTTSTSQTVNNNWAQLARKLLKPEEVTGLDPRTAITFVPNTPPIGVRLVRYYEKGFGKPTGLGPFKMAIDAASLFFLAAMFAAMFTAAVYYGPAQ